MNYGSVTSRRPSNASAVFPNNTTKPKLKNEKGYINEGCEDQMELFGYVENKLYTALAWISIIMTLGIVRLMYHWWPRFHLYTTHQRSSLDKATKLLVVESQSENVLKYYVENVSTIKISTFELDWNANTPKKVDNNPSESLLVHNLFMYFADGSKKEVSNVRGVYIKKTLYVWSKDKHSFIKLVGIEKGTLKKDLIRFRGFSGKEQNIMRQIYGRNEIMIPSKTILYLIFRELIDPFYVYQNLLIIIWIIVKEWAAVAAYVALEMVGIYIRVYTNYQAQRKLEDNMETGRTFVRVKRGEDEFEDTCASSLVPGDVFVVPGQGFVVPCDAVLIKGSCYVYESMLTGESFPLLKTSIQDNHEEYHETNDVNHTLYCGSQVVETRSESESQVLAVVTRTGYLTNKGTIMLAMLFPPAASGRFIKQYYTMMWVLAFIGLSGWIYSLVVKLPTYDTAFEAIVFSLSQLSYMIPPSLPFVLSLGVRDSTKRLHQNKISCTKVQLLQVAGLIDCVCFDKTGTLTEHGLDMLGVVPVRNAEFEPPIDPTEMEDSLLLLGMTSCHSLTLINGVLCGDPFDLKMFESTDWRFVQATKSEDSNSFTFPTVLNPNTRSPTKMINILYEFPFCSSLKRMSVITKVQGRTELTVYCKGAPSVIEDLCNTDTVPENTSIVLNKYTSKGFRVIAMASKSIPNISIAQVRQMNREYIESNLEFLGYIVMENKLKNDAVDAIKSLRQADIKCVVCTGDNTQTAMCIARDSGFLTPGWPVVEIDEQGGNIVCYTHFDTCFKRASRRQSSVQIEDEREQQYNIAITGKAWSYIRKHKPCLMNTVLVKTAVYSMVTSDQKQQIVIELQKSGLYVAMCGDGANDCAALKSASIGISLSGAEASIASPFTSHCPSVHCVPELIKEGRTTVVTITGLFKYFVYVTTYFFIVGVVLHSINCEISILQALFLFIVYMSPLTALFGRTRPYQGDISTRKPKFDVISLVPILSFVIHSVIATVVLFSSIHAIRASPWYFQWSSVDGHRCISYENYVVFSASMIQFIIPAVIFSTGFPYRQPMYSNVLFYVTITLLLTGSSIVIIYPPKIFKDFFSMILPPTIGFPCVLLSILYGNFCLSYAVEKNLIEHYLINKIDKILDKKKKVSDAPDKTVAETLVLFTKHDLISRLRSSSIHLGV